MQQKIQDHLARCRSLPSLPVVAAEIVQLSQDDKLHPRKLADIVKRDPAIAAKVLRYANSAFFGFKSEITTISQATVLLGIGTVRTIALSFSLLKELSQTRRDAFDYNAFWRRSLIAAVAGRELATFSGTKKEEAFLASLLQNIGSLALVQVVKNPILTRICRVERHMDLRNQEQKTIGVDHAEIGAWLTERWNLPECFVAAIRWHHAPDDYADKVGANLVKTAAVSDLMAELWTAETSDDALTEARILANRFWSVDDAEFADIIDWIGVALPETLSVFDVQLCPETDLERIQSDARTILASTPLASVLEDIIDAEVHEDRAA